MALHLLHRLHWIEVPEPVPFQGRKLLFPGSRYLIHWRELHTLLDADEELAESIRTWPFEPRPLERGVAYRRIYLIRSSGLGDLLLMTPMIQAMRREWPESEVVVLTSWRGEILDGVVDWEMLPFDEIALTSNDLLLNLEDFDLFELSAPDQHCIDFLAGIAGVHLGAEDRQLLYDLRPSELAQAFARFPRSERPRVGLHFVSVRSKSWPIGSAVELTSKLAKQGWEVFWFGSPGQVGSQSGLTVTNLSMADPPIGIRESAAILKTCDVVVSVDSVVTHLCSALDVPNVVLFGSFPSRYYVTGKRVRVLEGTGVCAPCFHYSTAESPWPPGGPCGAVGQCVVLESLRSDEVLEAVRDLVQGSD